MTKHRMVFEVIRTSPNCDDMSPEEEADNLYGLIEDALGFPKTIKFEVKTLSKEDHGGKKNELPKV